jgi:predicted DNA-binding transcriptional regulator AlpA
MELLTTREVADMFRVTRQTIFNWHKTDPDFPAPVILARNTWRWRKQEVSDYMRRQAAK